MRLSLLRHPPPLVASGICYGQTDVACAPDGLASAAQALRPCVPQGMRIVCSPLQRCVQLAQALQERAPGLTYETDARLAEMHFGAWEMQAWANIAPRELQAWTDDFAHFRCGGSGESSALFVRRVALRLRDSLRCGQDDMWITHAGVIRALHWLHQQPLEWRETLWQHLDAPCMRAQEHRLWGRQLHARDWPTIKVAFGQVQTMAWLAPRV
jgi:alpha-ribazole phosphatase